MKLRAYTLVEVLVVIALIGLLAAMIFPVLARAKLPAHGTVCTSNLKQIWAAAELYRADFDTLYPAAVDAERKFSRIADLRLDLPLLKDVLAPYTKDDRIWMCPLDTGIPHVPAAQVKESVEATIPGSLPTVHAKHGMSYLYDHRLGTLGLADPVAMWDTSEEVERGPAEIPLSGDIYGMFHGSQENRRLNLVYLDGHVARMPKSRWPVWAPGFLGRQPLDRR